MNNEKEKKAILEVKDMRINEEFKSQGIFVNEQET